MDDATTRLVLSRARKYFTCQASKGGAIPSTSNALIGYFKHDLQDLVDAGTITLAQLDCQRRIHIKDVERILPPILEHLVEEHYIEKVPAGYRLVPN